MQCTSIREMMEAGVHLGHRKRRRNPKMRPFIYGERAGNSIIDLEKTSVGLESACDFISQAAACGKRIVFVGTKNQASEIVEEEARRCGVFFVNRRWPGGLLTNFQSLHLRVERLNELEAMRDTGEFFARPKREIAILNRELYRLERCFGGIKKLHGQPDIVFLVDKGRERLAAEEAKKLGITILALLDTDSDPEGVDFVIPGNDDSIRSIALVTRRLADAIIGHPPNVQFGDGDWQPSGVPRKSPPAMGGAAISLTYTSLRSDHFD